MSDTRLEGGGPRNRELIPETATVIGATFGLVVLGSLLLLALDFTSQPLVSTLLYLGESLGWRSLIWAVLTVVIAAVLRNTKRRTRAIASTVAGGVAVTAATYIRLGPSISSSGVFATGSWILELGGFVICVLLGWTVATQLRDRSPRARVSMAATLATAILIVTGTVGIHVLFQQWARLYFRLWASTPVGRYEDFGPEGTQYLVTTGITLGALAIAIELSFARHKRATGALAIVMIIVALGAAFLFQVPSGRFFPDRPQDTD
ncbi:hypothetical protein M2152_002165 [Microbacteriaceae bacterium SG_E_30_P1]|uniref:Uncharacterized protein n=1 Tax=Antiquaquibacter oligotrophicus TaxID=2880260 RepID=A0ABT6KPS3_9MICO|nr:hypothetical protein [Antiquaquibacter oligotrophicus]MDH6181983.1 hypothetical protein [Antiquaquibacter oligotrophicus]UDF12348.1 hypothetical protein LH407_09260 [Antiquaquibacter oligotrophicus]